MVKKERKSLSDEERGRMERFNIVFKDSGLNQTLFAKKIGSTQQAVSEISNGVRVCGKSFSSKLFKSFGVNPEWFDTGIGEKYLSHPNTEFCMMCALKDKTIAAQQETIESQKETIESQRETIRLLREKYEGSDSKKVG